MCTTCAVAGLAGVAPLARRHPCGSVSAKLAYSLRELTLSIPVARTRMRRDVRSSGPRPLR